MSSRNEPYAEAEDPSDFNQRRRLKTIADAQDRAHEVLLMADAGINEYGEDLDQTAFAAVKSYAEVLRWSVARHGDEKYYDKHLGAIEISPPEELVKLTDSDYYGSPEFETESGSVMVDKIWGEADVDPKRYAVVGLYEKPDAKQVVPGTPFTELPPICEASWTVTVEPRHQHPQQRAFSQTSTVPASVSWAAFNLCNRFLNETELDVRINDGGLPAIRGFDQSRDEPAGELASGRADNAPEL